MESVKGGMVWRCNSEGIVLEVIKSDFPALSAQAVQQPFTHLLQDASQTAAAIWFKQLPESSSLLGELYLNDSSMKSPLTVGATLVANEYWLFWNTTPVATNSEKRSSKKPKEAPAVWEPDLQHVELLEELSRVNNELINARRELIRQNIELHRVHQKTTSKKSYT